MRPGAQVAALCTRGAGPIEAAGASERSACSSHSQKRALLFPAPDALVWRGAALCLPDDPAHSNSPAASLESLPHLRCRFGRTAKHATAADFSPPLQGCDLGKEERRSCTQGQLGKKLVTGIRIRPPDGVYESEGHRPSSTSPSLIGEAWSMTWSYWVGAGGSLPVMFLLYYAMRRTRGVVEMFLKAHLEARAEREQRATMVAMAQSLPDGGAAARFEQGRPAWLFRKDAAAPPDHPAITTREAA